jgi:hypothetical protein
VLSFENEDAENSAASVPPVTCVVGKLALAIPVKTANTLSKEKVARIPTLFFIKNFSCLYTGSNHPYGDDST